MHYPQSQEATLAFNVILEELLMDPIYHTWFVNLNQISGACYVLLYSTKDGIQSLRGRFGSLLPVQNNLYNEICENARSAAFFDPNFPPLQPEEIEDLSVVVDVVEPLEAINILSELDTKVYGVMVERGLKKGVVFPNLEGIDTAEKQLSLALQRARLKPNKSVKLSRFKVVRYF
jgi:AMMECR1 domain-containing protein